MSVPRWLAVAVAAAVADERRGGWAPAGRAALGAAARLYGLAVALRNAAYDGGVRRVRRLDTRVVCVGNLTAGGTGKTPTVLALAAALRAAGQRPCILLRGYGGTVREPVIASDGGTALLDWRTVGDEAVFLAGRAGVPVVVGADRVRAGELALRRFDPGVILLDDGFQHRRLFRDVDLVLLDGADPFGGGRLLPRGRLREPAASLARAHALLVTRADEGGEREKLRGRLRHAAPGLPLGWARHRPTAVIDLSTGTAGELGALEGRRVLAVSGIANPASFERALRSRGAELAGRLRYPDHHAYTAGDRAAIAQAVAELRADAVLTTEKDAVRLAPLLPLPRPAFALRVELEVVEGEEALASVLGVTLRGRDG